MSEAPFLDGIALRDGARDREGFPFGLPLVQRFQPLRLGAPVTFFVGENGSGKSTLLEALAAASGTVAVGRQEIDDDDTLAPARSLGRELKLFWRRRSRRGFFMRAEDFFGFSGRLRKMVAELDADAVEYERTLTGYGLQLARGTALGQRAALTGKYGQDLDANSHGEGFFKLLQARVVPDGLYLLDEPETPLSPRRQLALLCLLMDRVRDGCQFIISTHSPILMAYPGAQILDFDTHPVQAVAYTELDHVVLTRDFLNHPDRYIGRLAAEA